ncbi:putative phage-associated protein [Rhizobium sp. BK316]|uniref:Panacea domain-containing protein n=1 Tax=Rhizobium sp. BK316 TaxID=2587053 RepID=UPI00161A4979|nr:type II toxin-antitoxin system antitoxin SocA domain-containing protein [Rhizobium sp. BK316]MBB3410835.1 putative phage-associated protein [Rhizobium sp. BK316]
MPRAVDVATYILDRQGEMSAMKLQKLVYYCQAWSLVWDDRQLFDDRIEAWANGPVCPNLYEIHRGNFLVKPGDFRGDKRKLDVVARDTIKNVLKFYAEKDAHWLSDLTHSERPWREARRGVAPGDRSNAEITHAAMAEYYGSL